MVGSRSAWADAGVFGRLARNWPVLPGIHELAERQKG